MYTRKNKIRWYKTLNKTDERGHIIPSSLLYHTKPEEKTLIVCQELEERHFAKFNSYFDFYDYLFRVVKESHRCFYEYIFSHLPQKPYFDLDIYLHGHDNEEKVHFSEEEAMSAVITLLACIRRVCPVIKLEDLCIKTKDLLIFNSNGDSTVKRSYHIIINNWCCLSSEHLTSFFMTIMDIYPTVYKPCIDHSMYKKVQAFRMYGCHKWGSERVKKLDPLTKWENEGDGEVNNMSIFLASLITNTSYCQVLPFFEAKVKVQRDYSHIYLDDSEVEKAMALCAAYEDCEDVESLSFPYRYREKKNGVIALNRRMPSFCKICEKRHDTENPQLIIHTHTGAVYFDCRRHPEKKKICIGYIDKNGDREKEEEKEGKKKEEKDTTNYISFPSFLDDAQEDVSFTDHEDVLFIDHEDEKHVTREKEEKENLHNEDNEYTKEEEKEKKTYMRTEKEEKITTNEMLERLIYISKRKDVNVKEIKVKKSPTEYMDSKNLRFQI
jgi:hypothetical protein